jgi:hypothetical protein
MITDDYKKAVLSELKFKKKKIKKQTRKYIGFIKYLRLGVNRFI